MGHHKLGECGLTASSSARHNIGGDFWDTQLTALREEVSQVEVLANAMPATLVQRRRLAAIVARLNMVSPSVSDRNYKPDMQGRT